MTRLEKLERLAKAAEAWRVTCNPIGPRGTTTGYLLQALHDLNHKSALEELEEYVDLWCPPGGNLREILEHFRQEDAERQANQ